MIYVGLRELRPCPRPSRHARREAAAHQTFCGNSISNESPGQSERASVCLTAIICQVANVAGQLNCRLRWDATKERFTDDEEANGLLDRPWRKEFALPPGAFP